MFRSIASSFLYTLLIQILLTGMAAAQTSVPFSSDAWQINSPGHLVTDYLGKEALYMNTGIATLKDVSIKNGIIEFNIAFPGQRGFAGAFFRSTDEQNYEDFYMRPHQSGNPDANQYTPVFNGTSGWQLYHGEGYGSPVTYAFNRWISIRIIFWEEQGQIFINDMNEPAIFIKKFKRTPIAGKLGFRTSLTPAYFSNFRYSVLEESPFEQIAELPDQTPRGMVTGWQVSAPFSAEELEGIESLETDKWGDMEWRHLKSEASGITNLARLSGTGIEANTVFARINIDSDEKQTKKLSFGYSDKVKVFVNGVLVYGGDNSFRTRDYRYLGTVGLFDELYIPLEEGENRVSFAVTENFGGWGIIAQFEDLDGITISGK